MSLDAAPKTVPSSLTKQCLQLHHPDQKLTNEAVELSAEFLRLFIVEARRRAAIEAECEAEAEVDPIDNHMTDDDAPVKKPIEIRADHVAKIAAELLLDLS
ncbi:hypothetical protein ACHAXT_001721 [Thalassiosira profunda]